MMKTLITAFMLLAFVLFFSFTAGDSSKAFENAQDGANNRYLNMEELFQYWEDYGYPDYVGGVFCTGGSMRHLTVLLTGDSEAAKKQILSSLVNASGLSFGTSKYSYNELTAVNDEIVANYMSGGSKIYGVGTGWTSSGDEVIGFGESGKEFRVVVSVDESVLAEYQEKMGRLYGDMVEIEAGSPFIVQ